MPKIKRLPSVIQSEILERLKRKTVARNMTPFEEEVFALVTLIDEGCGMEESEDMKSQLQQWIEYQKELEAAVDRVRWQFQLAQINGPAVRESAMVI